MEDESYERLAGALEALPGGFPRIASGVELRLLKKAFTVEEAELAGHLSREYEAVDEIAARAGMPKEGVRKLLRGLLPRKLVRRCIFDSKARYRLGPFIVGWYEALMGGPMRDDIEFVTLFEQYMRDGGGERIMSPRPGVLGVVPVRGSLKPGLLQPYDDIDAHFARHERFGVSDCVCRIERNLLGSECSKPVKRCGFVGLPPKTPLSEHVLDREQAMELFSRLEEEGHVHTGFYGFISEADTPQFVGCCNCCGDCCSILRSRNEFGIAGGPQKSNYRAVLDANICIACGDCISRCQVQAIEEGENSIPEISRDRCIGCGLCMVRCPVAAIELVPVSPEEWFNVPSSFEEWEERRIQHLREIQA